MNTLPRPRIPISAGLALTAVLLAATSGAHAVVIGEPVALSAIGAPLRVEIAASGDLTRAGECLVLSAGPTDDGLPWVRDGRISVAGRGHAARIVVTGKAPVFEPVVKLGVEDVCDARLRREYTLLLSFPELSPPVAESAATPDRPDTVPVAPPPRPAATAPRAAGNGEAPTRPSRAPKTPDASARTAPTAAPQAPNATPPAPAARNDRLVLGGGEVRNEDGLRLTTELASVDRIRVTTDAERDQLRREQNVVMAIDRTILAQLEMGERIRQLEEIQAAMLERARNLGAARASNDSAASPPAAPQPGSALRDWLYPTLAIGALSLLLAAALLGLRRRRTDAEAADVGAVRAEPLYRAPTEAIETPQPPVVTGVEPKIPAAVEPEQVAAQGEPQPQIAERAPMQWHAPSDVPVAPVIIDEEAEEHESAIELAEIMMGFGRVQGAAETLVEFINSNPKRAVTPWLKLLEVYRAGGYRMEFDTLARQLNKTFNVKSVTWDTFDEARQASNTIEQMAHVIGNIQRTWGSRDCQAYLEKLLRDNRDGTREGFPLSVIDEILMLAGVLEEQLGAYRPSDLPDSSTAAA
jgi:pilus assembly protein FimV